MAEQRDFQQTVAEALNKKSVQLALDRATGTFKQMRSASLRELGYFEELRDRARDAKDRVLNNLDNYLLQLERSFTRAGGQVHWAADGRQAVGHVLDIVSGRGLKTVVKGKSMTTEEVHLNTALEQAGLDVFETDLGEYIVQLLGERPSHILAPAFHKTKEDIARLFADRLGIDYTVVPEELTAAARRELRTRFLSADVGITGVNFAVAETGTLAIMENEGNIRMATTLPRVHIAVMGLEKVVADLDDLALLLQTLPMSATGQRLSSYVSLLTGPGRSQGEGPEELHLIILDGFRSSVLADPEFRQVLRCLRCGACLNYCPVYRRVGGHTYPWVYSGPIGVALTAAAHGLDAAKDIISASTLCGACGAACPVRIDLPGLILEARRRLAAREPVKAGAVTALARGLATPAGFDLAARAMGLGASVAMDSQGRPRRFAPDGLHKLARNRKLSGPAAEPFRRSLFRGLDETGEEDQ